MLAIFTGALAWKTRSLAEETKVLSRKTADVAEQTRLLGHRTDEVASATHDLAEQTASVAVHSLAEAEATVALSTESQRDRELAWRPILRVEMGSNERNETNGTLDNGRWWQMLRITNLGNGPALDCFWLKKRDNKWAIVEGFDLDADGVYLSRIESNDGAGNFPIGIIDPPPTEQGRGGQGEAVMCEDVLGTRWRFLPGFPPERYRPGTPNPPEWARSVYAWHRSGVKDAGD